MDTNSALGVEFCSLPNCFCSFPNEMTKMPLRELTHASVNLQILQRELSHVFIICNFFPNLFNRNAKCYGKSIDEKQRKGVG